MTEGYCESETTGGELPEVNHQSETERSKYLVNSIRPKLEGELSELRRSPHRAHASDTAGMPQGIGSTMCVQTEKSSNLTEKGLADPRGGWSRNDEKRLRDKQGSPTRAEPVFMPPCRRAGREGDRASVVAMKRVTTVE